MSKSSGLWVHCGVCKTLGSHLQFTSASLNITSCGKVICSSCLPTRPQTNDCAVCQGSCSMMSLNSKAPANVLNMFKDASTQLKTLTKSLRWQEDQKQRIKKHQEAEVRRLEAEVEQQQEELAKVERQVEERRVQLRMQEKLESQLKYRLSSLNLGRLNKDLERSGRCEKETQRSQDQPQRAPQTFAAPPRHTEAVENRRALPLSSAFYRRTATSGPSPSGPPQPQRAPPRHTKTVGTPRALPLSSAFYRGTAIFGPSLSGLAQPQPAPQTYSAPPRHTEAFGTPRALPLSSAFYRGMAAFGPSANKQHLATQQACCYDNKSTGASTRRSDQLLRK